MRAIFGRFEPVGPQDWLKFCACLIHAGARESSVESSAKRKIMKLSAFAFASIIVAGWAGAAGAGVVIQGQEQASRSVSPRVQSTPYTMMIEGKQEKIVLGSMQLIIDLAANKVLVMMAGRGAYFELPYPPPSDIGQLILRRILPPTVKYKKTGKHLTLAGHGCDQYAGMGALESAAVSVEACYSTDAPGAQDYAAFVKNAAAKAGQASAAASDEIPQGIPLELDATITLPKRTEAPPLSGQKPLPPEKPVVVTLKTVVTSVASRSIEAREFQPPAGLKLEQPPRGLGIKASR